MKSFQIEWNADVHIREIYQIPLQEEGILKEKKNKFSADKYYSLCAVVNAHNKKSAIKKFYDLYRDKILI